MDHVYRMTGHFGRCHIAVCVLPVLVAFLSAFHVLAPIYVMFDPVHRCRLPEESVWHWNDTLAVQSDEHNASILSFIPERQDNSSMLSRCSVRVNNSEQTCSDWVFGMDEFDNTLVTELGLLCKRSHWNTLISMCSFAGILVGIIVSGYISDWQGRRISLIITLWTLTVGNTAALFSVSVAYSAIVRFVIGLGAMSSYGMGNVILFELVGPNARHHLTAVFGYSWSLGTAAVALVAYFARSWRSYCVMTLVPTVVLLVLAHFPYFVPETPLWLMSRGRDRQAYDIVRRMLAQNGMTAEAIEAAIRELQGGEAAIGELQELQGGEAAIGEPQELQGGEAAQHNDAQSTDCSSCCPSVLESLRLLMRNPRLLLRYAIMCCNWFLVSEVYFGLSMGAKNLPGSIFMTSCLIGIVDLPSYLILQLATHRIGRRATFVGALSGSGLALIGLAATKFLAKDCSWLIIAFSLVGKMLNSTCIGLLYIWTGELYPTNHRGAGVSISSAFARLGSLLAPLLGNIRDFIPGDFGPLVSYIVFAVSSFTGAGMAMALPETRGLAIVDTFENLIQRDRGADIEIEMAGELQVLNADAA